ncbi:uncharacterized protein EV154DRAFT_432872 [Mucor mucedo]|uniref:uncharacterized protein n=1 Tax=Mucor mucedo TaxID=29922 RepID=UPI00221ED747|nr:uncharacterized protein EV154DRAFT_432872 [Mucor mucedo]KAI7865646.1 hypothetical protein EV154DRAFT_432872 [Mucor mucedo]
MGKKVTFGIEFANVSNVEDVIKKNLDNYKLHIANDQKEQAVQLVIDTTEMVLFEDPVVLHHLPTMIKYCQKAIKLLKDDQDDMFIPRYSYLIYTNMSQCYLKLDEYPLAIKHGLLTIDIYKRDEQPSNRSNLQAIYKQLGDIYFTKSLNQDECRHDDFDNALQFYKLEREVIDTMDLSDIEDSEPNDLLKLTQASHLNMGVMESKISAFEAAIENIKQAVAIAIQLNDFVAEKTAWWELGNLYKRMNQLNNVLFCQGKEYRIVKRHGLRDDEFYCFEEQCE